MSTINLKERPSTYEVCFQNECTLAKTCLRHICTQDPRKDERYIRIVNPTLVKGTNEKCGFYRSDQPVRVAYGIKHIFDNVPHIKHDLLYSMVKCYFGKNTFYRIYHKERPIWPDEQEVVQSFFTDNGIKEPVEYEEYKETIKW